MFGSIYKIWMLFDPRLILIGTAAGLVFVAVFIHALLLSTDRYNWVEAATAKGVPNAAHYVAPPAK